MKILSTVCVHVAESVSAHNSTEYTVQEQYTVSKTKYPQVGTSSSVTACINQLRKNPVNIGTEISIWIDMEYRYQ